jgi:hypothetical protein
MRGSKSKKLRKAAKSILDAPTVKLRNITTGQIVADGTRRIYQRLKKAKEVQSS